MIRSIARVTGALVVLLFITGLATAQSPAVSPKNAEQAVLQQQQQQAQPLNNQPVWSEIRSGAPQITTVRGRETNVLIQPEGQTWRALRVPILFWGGLRYRSKVHLHARYMLGTVMFVVAPVFWRLLRNYVPGFQQDQVPFDVPFAVVRVWKRYWLAADDGSSAAT